MNKLAIPKGKNNLSMCQCKKKFHRHYVMHSVYLPAIEVERNIFKNTFSFDGLNGLTSSLCLLKFFENIFLIANFYSH